MRLLLESGHETTVGVWARDYCWSLGTRLSWSLGTRLLLESGHETKLESGYETTVGVWA